MNLRQVVRLLGILLAVFSLSMLTVVPFAMYYGEWQELLGFLEALAIGGTLGLGLAFIGRRERHDLFRREALAVVGLSWLLVSGIGALPLVLTGSVSTYTDAYFEAASGITTTGATIMRDIESLPRCVLYWRSFLHFVGGLGIIVFFVAILPILGVGGKALFKQEVPGPVPSGFTPRIKDTALALAKIYIGLNIFEMVILWLAGMTPFDAINHAFSTMATGGFSTKNTSVAAFQSPLIEWIITLFMFLGGCNFSLYQRALGGDWKVFFHDIEFRVYVTVIVLVAFAFAGMLYVVEARQPAVSHEGAFNLRDGFFTAIAIMTTTGFGTVDFDLWPPAARVALLILMFVGGMAGSTAGGMKLIRWIILAKTAVHEMNTEVSPRQIHFPKLGKTVLDRNVQREILAFFFIYFAIFGLGSLLVALASPLQDIDTTISAVASCLNNIGPGISGVGPTMNYADQTIAGKWLLSLLMVMGRLELYAILLLFGPSFWRGH